MPEMWDNAGTVLRDSSLGIFMIFFHFFLGGTVALGVFVIFKIFIMDSSAVVAVSKLSFKLLKNAIYIVDSSLGKTKIVV